MPFVADFIVRIEGIRWDDLSYLLTCKVLVECSVSMLPCVTIHLQTKIHLCIGYSVFIYGYVNELCVLL